MARDDWFVDPDVVRLPLSEGQWLDVKKELNTGDTRDIFTDLVTSLEAGSAAKLDPKNVGISKILVYVLDWSLQRDGKKVKFCREALLSLRPKKYQEIADAVDAHDAQATEEIAERKNDPAAETVSLST